MAPRVDTFTDIRDLKDRHPLAGVVEDSGVHLRGRGRVRQGLCPFHREQEPSFTVYEDTQRFYCFGCGAMGDVLDYVRLSQRVDLPEAIRLLDRTPPPAVPAPAAQRRAHLPVPRSLPRNAAVLAAAARFYAAALRRSPEARDYLLRRGIHDVVARLGIGYALGQGLLEHLKRAGFGADALAASGLFLEGRERFAGRVVVPEVRSGRVSWVTGRSIGMAEPRFQALPGPRPPLIGRTRLNCPRVVILTEGLFDWLLLMQWGLPACAVLGSHGLERVAAALAGCARVYLAMDSDDAGLQATERLVALLGPRAVPVSLPQGIKDVADLALHPRGPDVFVHLLARARKRIDS